MRTAYYEALVYNDGAWAVRYIHAGGSEVNMVASGRAEIPESAELDARAEISRLKAVEAASRGPRIRKTFKVPA